MRRNMLKKESMSIKNINASFEWTWTQIFMIRLLLRNVRRREEKKRDGKEIRGQK